MAVLLTAAMGKFFNCFFFFFEVLLDTKKILFFLKISYGHANTRVDSNEDKNDDNDGNSSIIIPGSAVSGCGHGNPTNSSNESCDNSSGSSSSINDNDENNSSDGNDGSGSRSSDSGKSSNSSSSSQLEHCSSGSKDSQG